MQRNLARNLQSHLKRSSIVSSLQLRPMSSKAEEFFKPNDQFLHRHMGSQGKERQVMLETVGFKNMEDLISSTVPQPIRLPKPLSLEAPLSESEALNKLKGIMSQNKVYKSFIGMGYHETLTPAVIQRNVLENPGWYTAYTPYQAEIAQGRLQSLLNFQTMVTDLTGLPLANASLLDESTAAAEAMSMCYSLSKNTKKKKFLVDERCHPQNIGLVQTRGTALGMTIEVGNIEEIVKQAQGAGIGMNKEKNEYCGVMVQYPDTYGSLKDWSSLTSYLHERDILAVCVTDLLASTLVKPAGELGFDIAVGSAQRFGVPMGCGGPHAAFLATTDAYSRKMPGRIIGVSIDSRGKPALRMAMQTREQHIRRDKATSNICTAQALLANMASFYAVYHGPEGLKAIAQRIHSMAQVVGAILTSSQGGYTLCNTDSSYFDTLTISLKTGKISNVTALLQACEQAEINLRVINDTTVGLSFGETVTTSDLIKILGVFGINNPQQALEQAVSSSANAKKSGIPSALQRSSAYLTHPNFSLYHSESKMLRYITSLENQDLSLNFSMISLGSCTMKLNATIEMAPVTWPETMNIHPYAPDHQMKGYLQLINSLHQDLCEITGFTAFSTQPNSGAQGEYAGLLCIRNYHLHHQQAHRNVCLIPISAHGTNPASATMCGMQVVVVKSDEMGNIDLQDLQAKALQYKDRLAAMMVTYPSTYGVFEEKIREMIDLVHSYGGLVYMDGANMNAQVALTSPGFIQADVCHLNLHKTFCIPHGGGGPGVGSIGVNAKLAPFLPGHQVKPVGGEGQGTKVKSIGAVSAAPYGSAAILPISWMYIKMLGEPGLREATSMAILNANYMAKRLEKAYSILYRGSKGQCAHEFIIDIRPFKASGVTEEDIAKRLQDYGFHSPTMSWPVSGTLMIEPTESEDKGELDRFVDSLLLIRQEIEDVVSGKVPIAASPLRSAPHTMDMVVSTKWDKVYTREQAAFPAPWCNPQHKFWPTVGRIDNVYGDRNLVCTCPPLTDYMNTTN